MSLTNAEVRRFVQRLLDGRSRVQIEERLRGDTEDLPPRA